MKKNIVSLLMIASMIVILLCSFVACNYAVVDDSTDESPALESLVDLDKNNSTFYDDSLKPLKENIDSCGPQGKINEGVVLVKTGSFSKELLGSLNYESVEPLYRNSRWYKITLSGDVDTEEAVSYLDNLDSFDIVDYDYVMVADGEVESIDISGNNYEPNPSYFKPMNVQDAWKSMKNDGAIPGGEPSVIVAVIDTGVDYNHVDLRNNIWTNSAEIPDNGIDDDGNGYIDDVYGWNFVGNNNNPMDDNGHGTHCAGIVAAENNKIGTVGIAYNCKVMCLKAGTSSGSFNNSDIAEAVRYAYMNGASVISMSFGGTSISMAVEDALIDAYNQCVLVAAAGNDGMCNQPGCPDHEPINLVEVFYPAALTYVIGVMSCKADGTCRSSFSNFDHYQYNTYEYDVLAPGEQIASTFPNNKYAKLSGTSMATPHVAAVAALVRSKYQDRETYSNKFIAAQLVRGGNEYICVDAYTALNELPTPAIYGIHDYYIFDNVEFDQEHNNGNGIIEAGETIHLGFELKNRGGKANEVTVSVNTKRLADDITDPYVHIISNDITYAEIGTYSIRDGGKIYDDNDNGKVIDIENPIIIKIDEETPNDYMSVINFVVTYKNGLNDKDTTEYKYNSKEEGNNDVKLTVTNGYILPSVISEDTVFEANRRYIVENDVVIPEGITVTFEEGCQIQFYGGIVGNCVNSPRIISYGYLNFNGTEENKIIVKPSELFDEYVCCITSKNNGYISFNYCDLWNQVCEDIILLNQSNERIEYKSCYIKTTRKTDYKINYYKGGKSLSIDGGFSNYGNLDNCVFNMPYTTTFTFQSIKNSVVQFAGKSSIKSRRTENSIFCIESDYSSGKIIIGDCCFTNNVILKNYVTSLSSQILPQIELEYMNITSRGNIVDEQLNELILSMAINNVSNSGVPIVNYFDSANHDDSVIWPYIKNIELFDKDGERIRTVGNEEVTVKVIFNRQMDKTNPVKLYYGSVYPYRDYLINGDYNEDGTEWIGAFKVTSLIEGGTNFFSITGGCAADDSFKTLINNAPAFTFDINTTSALSMTMFAEEKDNGIELSWIQDDYDTLMGYNVYRFDEKDGNYVKLNTSVIPAGENTFLDENAEPGKTYWYTFTVVLSDMSESKPAGKISATVRDTIAPNAYHTPVNQGYLNNNLVISCTASDNVSINNANLYYRTKGETAWKVLTMLKQNDKYSATVFGSELSLNGLEYYIVVSDGINEITKGNAENPYTVIIKDASAISRLGDVDGDGVVTTKDALMLMQCINGDLILTDDEFKRADLNKNNVLSSVEALRILQYINGNVATLEM